MLVLPSWRRFPGRFTIVFGVLLVALYVIEQINGRFWLNDFRVYYGAGEAILRGEPLYGIAHGLGSGYFKYAPLLAVIYSLFALLPYSVAASLHYTIIAFAFLDGSRRIDRLVRQEFFNRKDTNYWPLFLTGLVCIVHLHRELHLGNINMLLLWLLVVALEQFLRARPTLAAILLGSAILAKPHFVVLLPLFLIFGKWKESGISLATIALGIILPAVFVGSSENMHMHRAWLGAMAEHNASLIYIGGEDQRAVNTVYSFLHRAVLKHFLQPSSMEAYALLGLIATGFGAFILWLKTRSKDPIRTFAIGYLLLVALVPSITLTDTEHFVFAMPLIGYMMHHLFPRVDPKWLIWFTIPVFFAYGGNWEDALGPLSIAMAYYGVLGLGTIFVILISSLLFVRSNLSERIVSNS